MGSSHSKEEALMGVEKLKHLGRGAFGEAFLVKKNSKLLVMKKIDVKNMDPKLMKYQLQEAELLRSIQHPNIVSYKGHAFENDMVCILMEYCPCGDLRQKINRQAKSKRPFAEEKVREWTRQLASGLKYIHAEKILHRDLKPNNIFIKFKTLKIGDFGLAKLLPNGSLLASSIGIGTRGYMAPDVIQGSRYGAKADMYSLGATIFHVATFSYPPSQKEYGELLDMMLGKEDDQAEQLQLRKDRNTDASTTISTSTTHHPLVTRSRLSDATSSSPGLEESSVFTRPDDSTGTAASSTDTYMADTDGWLTDDPCGSWQRTSFLDASTTTSTSTTHHPLVTRSRLSDATSSSPGLEESSVFTRPDDSTATAASSTDTYMDDTDGGLTDDPWQRTSILVPVVYSVRLRHLIAVLMSQRPEDRPSANDTLAYLAEPHLPSEVTHRLSDPVTSMEASITNDSAPRRPSPQPRRSKRQRTKNGCTASPDLPPAIQDTTASASTAAPVPPATVPRVLRHTRNRKTRFEMTTRSQTFLVGKPAAQLRETKLLSNREAREELKASTSAAVFASSSSSAKGEDSSSAEEAKSCLPPKRLRKATKNIVSPSLLAALDCTQLSDRKATIVLTKAPKSLCHDTTDLASNRTTIARSRRQARRSFAENLKKDFQADVPLTVHWDGKLLQALTTKEHVDRLPILISGVGVRQLLGVSKLPSGTGEAQAQAVFHALEEWGVTEKVVAMSFDTAAANTGHRTGACILLEQKIGRDLLYLACRHHIMEVILAAAFGAVMGGGTSGPEALLFKRFQSQWDLIDKEAFQPGTTDDAVNAAINPTHRDEAVAFAMEQLTIHRPRDDCKELLELLILFLGHIPPRGVQFRAPGPMHHARWMSKIIYAFKVWMFKNQFRLTIREENALRDLCIFGALLYVEAWITSTSSVQAPRRDLHLIKALVDFPNLEISKATSEKMKRYLWYLGEETTVLALFDDAVSIRTKKDMVKAISGGMDDEEEPPQRAQHDLGFLKDANLEDFVSPRSLGFFEKVRLPTDFLHHDPEEWPNRDDYQKACRLVNGLEVVNDHAERGVSLVKTYNRLLTKDEEQLQFLLQVVSEHRKLYPDTRKKTLAQTRQQSTECCP